MSFKRPFRAVPIRPGAKYMRRKGGPGPTSVAFKKPFVAVPVNPLPKHREKKTAETAVETRPIQNLETLAWSEGPRTNWDTLPPSRLTLGKPKQGSSWGPVQLLLIVLVVSIGSLIGISAADWLN